MRFQETGVSQEEMDDFRRRITVEQPLPFETWVELVKETNDKLQFSEHPEALELRVKLFERGVRDLDFILENYSGQDLAGLDQLVRPWNATYTKSLDVAAGGFPQEDVTRILMQLIDRALVPLAKKAELIEPDWGAEWAMRFVSSQAWKIVVEPPMDTRGERVKAFVDEVLNRARS